MNKRLLIFTLFIACVYTLRLSAQDRLGVYAAAFYNLEIFGTQLTTPTIKVTMISHLKENMNGLSPSMNKNYRTLPK